MSFKPARTYSRECVHRSQGCVFNLRWCVWKSRSERADLGMLMKVQDLLGAAFVKEIY